MSALRSWLRGSSAPSSTSKSSSPAVSASASTTGLSAASGSGSGSEVLSAVAQEMADLQDAMDSTSLLLNDDIDGAEARLRARRDSSAFHQLGLGVSTFMRSILGFEKEAMAEANSRLTECETRAWDDMKKAQREAAAVTAAATAASTAASSTASSAVVATQIYPPGSEFALVHAEAQVMLAVVAELHESLTEAIRGFYKLRKAFVALNAIIESEDAYLRGETGGGRPAVAAGTAVRSPSFSEDPMPGGFDSTEFADLEAEAVAADDDDSKSGGVDGGSAAPAAPAAPAADPEKKSLSGTRPPGPQGPQPRRASDLDALTNPVDIFVHSGANMCFGIMLLLISMVPPAFSRLLSIVGFKGDRDRGVRMLWQSTKFANINGGMAGLVLLAYYNGLVAYSDIVPGAADVAELAEPGEIVGYPAERCAALLEDMRRRYPDSLLWVLEEARLLSTKQQAREAIAVLERSRPAKMRQITALTKFELALDAMCVLDWVRMRDAFLACVELNNWSHALYYYNVGCAEVELYRTAFHRAAALGGGADRQAAEAEAAGYKKAAEQHLRKAPTMAGKKKFMARQMPFDLFVIRKVARWEERAKALGLDLADAVGVSPALEMAYLWNGSKRMSPDLLEAALGFLAWERCTAGAQAVAAFQAAPDESAIGSLCRASLLRALGRLEAAQAVLDKEILIHDRAVFKGPHKDDYVLPSAHYEAAAIRWTEACDPARFPAEAAAAAAFRRQKVEESQAYLDKVAKWETFVLDARIGMKLQTGVDTIRWLKKKKNWQ